MKLAHLLNYIRYEKIIGDMDVNVDGLSCDSRKVEVDHAFFCYRGVHVDSCMFVDEAINNGASVLFVEHPIDCKITQVVVSNGRVAMAECARAFYGFPDKKLKIVAVTGTNGKTTITYMLDSIFRVYGKKCAVVGTLGIKFAERFIAPELTTPDPICLHHVFAEMVEEGVEYVFMEVSAHALYFDKLQGVRFEVGIFTNCTQDHLDFFGDMKSYAECKKSLFISRKCRYSVVNVDDPLGMEIAKEGDRVLTYGLKNPADVFGVDVKERIEGTTFLLNAFDALHEVELNMPALHNVYNAMGAATCAALLGVSVECIAKGLKELNGVSGRLERVGTYQGGTIFVDFAHTPDGLEKSLQALKPLCKGRLLLVFGCGGNRDKSKRPIMGGIANRYADFCILTSDNPRYEDPLDIIYEIESGIKNGEKKYVVVTDRAMATEYALRLLSKDDVLLVAGKGGETYQEIMGIKYDYNDNNVIKNFIG